MVIIWQSHQYTHLRAWWEVWHLRLISLSGWKQSPRCIMGGHFEAGHKTEGAGGSAQMTCLRWLIGGTMHLLAEHWQTMLNKCHILKSHSPMVLHHCHSRLRYSICGSEQTSMKPVLGDWQSSYRRSRCDEIILCHSHIGHKFLTHNFILAVNHPPQCKHCQCILTWQCIIHWWDVLT